MFVAENNNSLKRLIFSNSKPPKASEMAINKNPKKKFQKKKTVREREEEAKAIRLALGSDRQ